MNFTPTSEELLKQSNLLEKGTYSFEVVEANDEISKSGNEMIKLMLNVWDYESGKSTIVFDYLLEKMAYKLIHFCQVTKLMDKYSTGELRAFDCLGKKGSVDIETQEKRENPSGGFYPAKNIVKDYNVSKVESFSPLPSSKVNNMDADVPF